MTPELLAHLTADERAAWERAQKATEGPWVSGVGSWNKSHWKHKAPLTCATGTLANFLVMGTGESSADGEFCAHARIGYPAALLALAQTKKANSELRDAVQDACAKMLSHREALARLRAAVKAAPCAPECASHYPVCQQCGEQATKDSRGGWDCLIGACGSVPVRVPDCNCWKSKIK